MRFFSRLWIACAFAISAHCAHASTPPTASNSTTTTLATSVIPVISTPMWYELTPEQRETLQPLGATWNSLSELQRKKWLAAVRDYKHLPDAEQAKIRERMVQWSQLTPIERERARDNFTASKRSNPSDKISKWHEYQALSSEEKKHLSQSAPAKNKKKGAAKAPQATKPAVSLQPVVKHTPRHPPSPMEMHRLWDGLNPSTLLPRP